MPLRIVGLILFLMGAGTMNVLGQLIVQPQLPLSGGIQRSQLWNLSVINNVGSDLTVNIQFTLTGQTSSTPQLVAESRTLRLYAGLNILTHRSVSPVRFLQVSPGFGSTTDPFALIPPGQYTGCYDFTVIRGDAREVVAEECVQFVVDPLSPAILVTPANHDSLDSGHPLFSWLPPGPSQGGAQLTYDLVIVKPLQGQSDDDAMQRNIPVLSLARHRNMQFQLPLSRTALETGTRYAWQVSVRSQGAIISKTEIWNFIIRPATQPARRAAVDGYFHDLQRNPPSNFAVCEEAIRFAYLHPTADSTIQVSLKDISSATPVDVKLDEETMTVQYGQNYLSIHPSSRLKLTSGKYYLLTVANLAGEIYFLKFSYLHKNN
ncbi:MAG: hypothetical protein ABWZ25_08760 [Chitinophagaceae bacterium]